MQIAGMRGWQFLAVVLMIISTSAKQQPPSQAAENENGAGRRGGVRQLQQQARRSPCELALASAGCAPTAADWACDACRVGAGVAAGCTKTEVRQFCSTVAWKTAVWHAAPNSNGGAASVVAALRAAGEAARLQNRATTVQLASGRYQLHEPLVLPSGVSLLGAEGGGTVLSGGVVITGWSVDGLAARQWLWRAPLPLPLRGSFDEFSNGPRKEGWANGTTDDAIRQLWVNGQRRGVARTELLRYLSVTGMGIVAKPGQLRRSYNSSSLRAVTYQHWTAAPRTVQGTSNLVCPEEELPGCLNKTCPAADFPCNQLDFTEAPYPFTGDGCGDKEGSGRRFYLQNAPEFLRAESGTFFADGESIYYSPMTSELADFQAGTANVMAARPGLRTLLHGGGSGCFPLIGPEYTDEQLARCGQNSSNTMRASDMVIEHTDTDELPCLGTAKGNLCTGQAASHIPSAAVHFMFATNVQLTGLTVRHVGGWGVWFGAGTRDCEMSHSVISDTGAGSARVGEAGDGACVPAYAAFNQSDYWCNETRIATNITVADSTLHDGGNIWPEASGVLMQVARNSTITHNEIHMHRYSGISNVRQQRTSFVCIFVVYRAQSSAFHDFC
jgi:hypothetical protein